MNNLLTLLKIASARSFGMPLYLIFFVTNRCNAGCQHCFYHDHLNDPDTPELSLDEIEKTSRHMGSLFTINLTGGEPFLRNDLDEIARLFYKNTHIRSIGIPTNGLLTDKIVETVKKILGVCPEVILNVTVSLDAVGPAHDRIRGVPGIFNKACQTIDALKNLGVKRLGVGISMTLSSENQAGSKETYRYIRDELKPDFLSLLLLRGSVIRPELKDVDPLIYQELCSEVERDIKNYFSGSMLSRIVGARDMIARKVIARSMQKKSCSGLACYAGSLMGVISETGDVLPCELLNSKLGNLRDQHYDFKKIWNSKDSQLIREKIKDMRCFCTHECFLNNNILFNKKYWLQLGLKVFTI